MALGLGTSAFLPRAADSGMPRPNLIVAGAVALAVVAAGAGLHLIFRGPHPEPPGVETTDSRIAVVQDPPRPPVAPPPTPRFVAKDEPPVHADTAPPAPRSQIEVLEQRKQLLSTHYPQALREADEHAFVKLRIPHDRRAAIRSLNENLTRHLLGGAGSAGNIQSSRLDYLEGILGREGARAFRSLETKEIRRLQIRYISQWDAKVGDQVLAPPNPPPPTP